METMNSGTVVYGIHPVAELIATRRRQIDRLYFDNGRASGQLFDLVKLARKERLPYQMVPAPKLEYLCGSDKHQGAVALCTAKEYTEPEELFERLTKKTTTPLLFLPASVEDPRNLGAVVRTCVAFGVDAILLERKNTAPVGATVAKASAGMLEHISLVKPKNLEGLVADLAAKGFSIVGAQQGAGKKPQEVDFRVPTVIITGGEDRGIPPYLAKKCTEIIGIPIAPAAQSLNVSAAAAILLYECARQRDFLF
jgi:23S rRNA (guanosine2251-2'-O)-methyltransferase